MSASPFEFNRFYFRVCDLAPSLSEEYYSLTRKLRKLQLRKSSFLTKRDRNYSFPINKIPEILGWVWIRFPDFRPICQNRIQIQETYPVSETGFSRAGLGPKTFEKLVLSGLVKKSKTGEFRVSKEVVLQAVKIFLLQPI
jgi:hypothetical protein